MNRTLLFSAPLAATLAAGLALAIDKPAAKFDKYDQSGVPIEKQPTDDKLTKIVLVAGTKSHGPGDHEFFAGTAILMNLLKQTDGVWPVMVRDGWPTNERVATSAAVAAAWAVRAMGSAGASGWPSGRRMAVSPWSIMSGAATCRLANIGAVTGFLTSAAPGKATSPTRFPSAWRGPKTRPSPSSGRA